MVTMTCEGTSGIYGKGGSVTMTCEGTQCERTEECGGKQLRRGRGHQGYLRRSLRERGGRDRADH